MGNIFKNKDKKMSDIELDMMVTYIQANTGVPKEDVKKVVDFVFACM